MERTHGQRGENDKARMARFIFNNLGGFAAVLAVFMAAGQVLEKLAVTSKTVDTVQLKVDRVEAQTTQTSTDVAVLKEKVSNIEYAQKTATLGARK